MKRFKVGDLIEGKTANGTISVGKIVKINKTTYKLDNGALIKFNCASEVNMEYWNTIVESRAKAAIQMGLKSVDYSKIPYEKVKNAFIALFGQNHYSLVINSIKKDIGL